MGGNGLQEPANTNRALTPHMLTIGLTQRVDVDNDVGERRDCLDQAWTALLVANGMCPVPLPNRVDDVSSLVSELGLDGVILTGGNDLCALQGGTNAAPERDTFEDKLLADCFAADLPVLGVCRGLQMMVMHYGGRVVPLDGHVGTLHAISTGGCIATPITDRRRVNSFHRFGVHPDGLGSKLRPLAFAPDGTVEAVRHCTAPQWAIFWHPERGMSHSDDVQLLRAIFPGVAT